MAPTPIGGESDPAAIRATLSAHHGETDLVHFDRAVEALDGASRDERLACARLLAELRLEPAVCTAALLLGQGLDPEQAVERFGQEAVGLADGCLRLTSIQWSQLGNESAENLRRMFLAMAADVRVVLLALADRVQVMRALKHSDDMGLRQLRAEETLDVYAPLANRIGTWTLKWELEDLALRELEPDTYRAIGKGLSQTRGERGQDIKDAIAMLEMELANQEIPARITGRPKHIYSIYKKMRRKGVPLEQIYDASAVRVLVDEVPQCYAVLGMIHGKFTPIPGEFDDYIARPKENLYQSLHTAVIGPNGRSLEIQIRTREMHQYAEYGVAAHWAYKEGKKTRSEDTQFNLLRQLMDWHKDAASADSAMESDPGALAESLKADIFRDRVYIFTPRGDVLDLPRGATVLDFAYRVHTNVGHRCRGAKIDDHIVPLDRKLENGDRVEVLTKKHPEPSRDWLNPHLGYLVTASAKQKIRQWFRQQGRGEAVEQGREALERELSRLGVEAGLDDVAGLFDYRSPEDLLAAIGFGDVGAHSVGARALDKLEPKVVETVEIPPAPKRQPKAKRKGAEGVSIDGVDGVMSTPARCCSPVPGDDVVGFISRGRGVVIHRRSCPNLPKSEPERLVEIGWGQSHRRVYPVELEVVAYDQPGVMRDVAEIISSQGVNMRGANAGERGRDGTATLLLTLEVTHTDQVIRILDRLERLACVAAVRRRRS